MSLKLTNTDYGYVHCEWQSKMTNNGSLTISDDHSFIGILLTNQYYEATENAKSNQLKSHFKMNVVNHHQLIMLLRLFILLHVTVSDPR